jgi:hypothetical protein
MGKEKIEKRKEWIIRLPFTIRPINLIQCIWALCVNKKKTTDTPVRRYSDTEKSPRRIVSLRPVAPGALAVQFSKLANKNFW